MKTKTFLSRMGMWLTPPRLRGSKIVHCASSIVHQSKTLTLLLVIGLSVNSGWATTFTKITSTTDLTSGDKYLIVCEKDALDGSRVSDGSEVFDVTIESNTIELDDDAKAFTITGSTGSWKITGSNNNTIGHTGSKNTLNTGSYTNTITFSEGDVSIGCNNRTLKRNSSSVMFRYYSSGQTAIQLYKAQSKQALSAPSNLLVGTTTSTSAPVSWSSVTDAGSYKVEYKTSSASTWTAVSPNPTTTSCTITGLTPSTTYNWRVTAIPSSTAAATKNNSAAANGTNFTTAAPAKHKVYFSANGTIINTGGTEVTEGNAINFPATATGCEGKTFMGWYGSNYSHATDAPTYVTSAIMGGSDVTYYAVFADAGESITGWQLSTTAPVDGDNVLFVGKTSDGAYKMMKVSGTTITVGNMTLNADGTVNTTYTPVTDYTWTTSEATYSSYTGLGFKIGSGNILHINSSAIKTASDYQNGTFEFTANGDGFEMKGNQNNRWLKFNSSTFTYSTTAVAIYVFKNYEKASYSNYTTTCSGDPVIEGLTITPSAQPDADGKYWEPITATISCTTDGVNILYSLDGSEPSIPYTIGTSEPISITQTSTLKVKATKSGYQDKNISQTFTFGKVYADVAAFLSDAANLTKDEKIKITDVKATISSFAGTGNTTVKVNNDAFSFYTDGTYCPSTYAVGRVLKGSNIMFTFKDYNPYQIRPTSWDVFTCISPLPNVTGLAETDKTATSVKLTWTAVTNAGSYVVKFDGVEQPATTNTYLEISDLEVKSTHNWYVKALTADEDVALDGNYGTTARQFTTLDVPHTVTFNAGDKGTCATTSLTEASVGIGVTLPECTANTGYDFKGWSTSETPTSANAGKAGDNYKPAKDITLYAYYTPGVYTISYQDQGGVTYTGTNLALLPETHTYNQLTTLVAGVKYGYQFDGWFGNPECTGDPMTSVAANTYSQDFTLYAKWTQIMPTSIVLSATEVTLAYDGSDADKKIRVTATVYPEGVSQNVSWSAAGYTDYATVSNNQGVCTITAKAEGEAIITCKSGVDDKVFAQVKVHVKHIPALTWLNADGTEFATTKATALNNGKVVLPVVDDEHQPVTCDDEYPYFYGWSTSAFNAQDAAPELVTAETDAPKDQTFYAVFAKGEGGTTSYKLTLSPSNFTTGYTKEGEISVDAKDIMSEAKESITLKRCSIMDTNVSGTHYVQFAKNSAGYIYNTTSLGKITSIKGDDENITNMSVYQGDAANPSATGSNKPYFKIINTSGGVVKYEQIEITYEQSSLEYTSYLSSCCTGYDITLTNGGTKEHGSFAAVAKECATKPVTLTANPEYGYSLNAWTVKETASENPIEVTPDGTDVNKATFIMPEAAVTVDAAFVANHHNVLFHKIAGQPTDQIVKQDFAFDETKALTLNSYERTGFKFEGWSSTGYSGEVAYTDGAEYTLKTDADVDLYAIWAADDAQLVTVHAEHMITDAPKEVSKTAESLSFNYTLDEGYKVTAVAVTVGTKTLTKNEIVFNQEGITITPEHNNFNNGAVVITFTVEEILYTVTLNPGSGTCEKTEVKQTAFGAAVTLPDATTIADGWTFAGWAAAAVETETETAPTLYTGNYTPASDLTLFAVYKRGEEIIGDTYTCDFETEGEPTNWKFSKFTGKQSNAKMPAVSGDYFGATTATGYVLLDKEITGKYRITASVGSTSNSSQQGTFEVKVSSGTKWMTVGSSVNVAGSSNQYKWKTLTWTGDLNNQQIEVYYTAGSTANRVIDNVVVEEISTKSYYYSTPSVVTDLKVTKAPAANTKYKEGETFNPAGIELTATYDNDKTKTEPVTYEMFTCDFSGAVPYGETTVTFTYKGKTCTQSIIGRRLQEISINTAPEKLEYVEGETFSNKSLSVNALFAFGEDTKTESVKQADLTYNPSLTTPLTTSNDKVTISYTWAGETKSVDQAITVVGKVKTPVISPNGGEITTPTEVTLSCETDNAIIYYTTDESDPTTSVTKQLYDGEFTVQPGQTVRAYAVREGWGDSEVAWATFSEKPVFDQGDWILVTDASELTAGSYVIIANFANNVAMKSYASGDDYCATATATFSQDGSMLTYNSNFGVFELREYKVGNEVKGMSFYDYNKKQYLYYSGSNNTLKAQNNQDNTAAWTFSQSENDLLITNYASIKRQIRYNSGANPTRFACYEGTQNSVQLYKYYKPTYKIIYNANGGTNAPVPSRAENGKAIVTDQQPTWGGYEFVKWTENQDGSGKVYTATEEVPLTADLTIYAQWQEKQLEGTPVALVVKYNDKYYAMGKDLSAVEVLGIINGKVAVTNDIDQKSITWYRNEVEGGFIFQNSEEKYLQGNSSTNLNLVEDKDVATTWNWDNDKQYYYTTIGGTVRSFFTQNAGNFKNYAVSNMGTGSYSSAATCYEGFLVGSEIISRATAPGKIGTICMEKDIVATDGGVIYMPDYKDATIKNVYFVEATDELATPGMPFIFVGEADNMRVLLGYEEVEDPVSDLDQTRGMIGSFEPIDDVPEYTPEYPYYCFQNNKLYKVGAGTKSQGHRAYMNMDYVPDQEDAVQDEPSAAPRRRLSMVNADADQGGVITGLGDVLNANNVQKLIINDKMYILRAGKMYDATGKFIK